MANAGRPTQFQIAAQLGKSWRAVVELGEDNRLPVPIDVSRRAPWLSRGQIVLAVLGDDGIAAMRPYDPHGKPIEDKLAELAEIGSDESESLMRAIRAKYLRLAIYDGRLTISGDIRACLGLPPKGAFFLSLIVVGEEATLKANGPREISEAAALLETIGF